MRADVIPRGTYDPRILAPGPAFHGFNGISSFENGRSPISQHPLAQFLWAEDGPWVPARSGVRSQEPSQPLKGPSLSMYTNPSAPSDCGTAFGATILPSDSGYESMTRQSVGNPSVVGEHDRSAEGVTSSFPDPQFQLQDINQAIPDYPWEKPVTAHSVETATNLTVSNLVCPHCNSTVKTKSELKYVRGVPTA